MVLLSVNIASFYIHTVLVVATNPYGWNRTLKLHVSTINVNSKIEYFLFGSVGVKSSFIDIMFRSGTTMAVMP